MSHETHVKINVIGLTNKKKSSFQLLNNNRKKKQLSNQQVQQAQQQIDKQFKIVRVLANNV